MVNNEIRKQILLATDGYIREKRNIIKEYICYNEECTNVFYIKFIKKNVCVFILSLYRLVYWIAI